MNALRGLLLLLLVVLPLTLRGHTPRLWTLAVERFLDQPGGAVYWETGLLDARGNYVRDPQVVPLRISFFLHPAMRNRTVILEKDWKSYGRLGTAALANFRVVPTVLGEGFPLVDGATYGVVEVSPTAAAAVGPVLNLSTRGVLTAEGEGLIGGFVVSRVPRKVLIRGIGPTLGAFGVERAASNPVLVLYRGATPVETNDDWGTRADAGEIEAISVQVGAFPLVRTSRDSALLVELAPGAYTAHLRVGAGSSGSGMIEVYLIDATALDPVAFSDEKTAHASR